MTRDINILAESNRDQIMDQLDALAAKEARVFSLKKKIDDVLEYGLNVKMGFISKSEPTTRKNYVLNEILITKKIKNIWEKYKKIEDQKLGLKNHFDARNAIDSHFVKGKKFKYLSANYGGIGMPSWGDEYIVIKKESLKKNSIGLKHDSLCKFSNGNYKYFNAEFELNKDFEKDVSPMDLVCKSLILKYQNNPNFPDEIKDEIFYPTDQNGGVDYYEVVTSTALNIPTFQTIRINKKTIESINKIALGGYNNSLTNASIKAWNQLNDLIVTNNLNCQVI